MSWIEDLYELDIKPEEDIDSIVDKSTQAEAMDVGVINDDSGTGILARGNGNLEGFADYGLGFRFNRENQTLSIFASNIKMFTDNFKIIDSSEKDEYLKDEYNDIMMMLFGTKEDFFLEEDES